MNRIRFFSIILFCLFIGNASILAQYISDPELLKYPGDLSTIPAAPSYGDKSGDDLESGEGWVWDCRSMNEGGDPIFYWSPSYVNFFHFGAFWSNHDTHDSVLIKTVSIMLLPENFVGSPDLKIILAEDDGTGLPGQEFASQVVPFEQLPQELSWVTVDFEPQHLTFDYIDLHVIFTVEDTASSRIAFAVDSIAHDTDRFGGGQNGQYGYYYTQYYPLIEAEICITELDNDIDEIANYADNCRENYNPEQDDTDYDGIGDLCDYICGDANDDLAVNVADIIYIINHIFKSGPAPASMAAVELNADLEYNIGDAVSLVSYIFRGNPLRCQPVVLYQAPPAMMCKNEWKDGEKASSVDKVIFDYDGVSLLKISHTNTAFNCCPLELRADVQVIGDQIIITESDTLQNVYGCECVCLFDFEYYIQNIPNGGVYTVTVFGECVIDGARPTVTFDTSQPYTRWWSYVRANPPWAPWTSQSENDPNTEDNSK